MLSSDLQVKMFLIPNYTTPVYIAVLKLPKDGCTISRFPVTLNTFLTLKIDTSLLTPTAKWCKWTRVILMNHPRGLDLEDGLQDDQQLTCDVDWRNTERCKVDSALV